MAERKGTAEYLDWSDSPAGEEGEGRAVKFGELDYFIDEQTEELVVEIKRETKTRRTFALFLNVSQARQLYEVLREHFGDEPG
jgi:hypothetical protein